MQVKKKNSNTSRPWIAPLSVILFLLLWEAVCHFTSIPDYLLPAPSQIMRSLIHERASLWNHSMVTLYETVLGLLLSILIGIAFALLMDSSPIIRDALQPLMVISQSVPIIALAPILMIYLGFGLAPKILAVVLMCFYPITISFREGLTEVNPGYLRLLQTMGASKLQMYRYVKFPSAFVSLFAGLRVSATYAISGALVGEWLSSQAGLGYYMLRQNSAFRLDRVFASVLVIVFWSLILTTLVRLLQYFCTPGKGYFMKTIRNRKATEYRKLLTKASAALLAVGMSVLSLTACQDSKGTGQVDSQDKTSLETTAGEDADASDADASEKETQSAETQNTETQSAETDSSNTELQEVTVILDYMVNTNHSGMYAAIEKGFYEEEGLKVNIVEPADGVTLQLLTAGKGDFGISYQEDLSYAKSSDSPLPLKAIATIIQHNTSGFASVKEKNILSPKDFVDKNYAGWGAESEAAVIHAVMKDAGVDPESINIISASGASYANLTSDVDLMWFFEAWDLIAAKQSGLELNYIACRDLDERLDYYTPIIVAKEDTLAKDPDMVKAFMSATTKGYEFAMDKANAPEIVEILLKHSPELDKELLLPSQEYLAEEYAKDAEQWGIMKDEVWDRYTEFMVENGLIEKSVPAADMYTNEFLPVKE